MIYVSVCVYRRRFCVLGFYDLWVWVCCGIFVRGCFACMRFYAEYLAESLSVMRHSAKMLSFNWISGLIESVPSVLFILMTGGVSDRDF